LSYMAMIVTRSGHEMPRWWVDCEAKEKPLPDLAEG